MIYMKKYQDPLASISYFMDHPCKVPLRGPAGTWGQSQGVGSVELGV